MDWGKFVQDVKDRCEGLNIKPTVACREAGVGDSFISNINNGSVPSVEKVQMLAKYFGVSTSDLLGESSCDPRTSLSPTETKLLDAYRRATPEIRRIVDGALAPYAKEKTTGTDAC